MEKNSNVNPVTEIPRHADMIFDQAVRRVLKHEGLFSNDPNDPGGPTKYGISLRQAKKLGDLDGDGKLDLDLDGDGDIDIDDIKALTIEKAIDVYKRVYWDPYPYNKLAPAIAIKIFDLNVNMGAKQAHLILQRAIMAANPADAVEQDGIVGPLTWKACNRQYAPSVLAAIRSEAAGFYRELVLKRPASNKYLTGWLNRAYS